MLTLKKLYETEYTNRPTGRMSLDPSTMTDGDYRIENQGNEQIMSYQGAGQTVIIHGMTHPIPVSSMLEQGWVIVSKVEAPTVGW